MEAIAIKHDASALPAAYRDHFMAALARVLGSRAFAKSARLSAFLRYVCMATLEGREKVLCEQHIGTAVFGRPDHYNPSDDTIVRSSARLLRQRLATYYEEEGQQDQFRISIPRGAYVPVFALAGLTELVAVDPADRAVTTPPYEALEIAPVAPPVTPASNALPQTRRRWMPALLVLPLLLGLASWKVLRTGGTQAGADSRFWAAMLPADHDTALIVSDNGLVMYQSEGRREVPLGDYIANHPGDADTPAAARSLADYGARRYTAMSSVTLAAELGKLAHAAPQRFHVRFARDVHLADLKHGNTILAGVEQSNPWWALYRKQFNFHIDWDHAANDFLIRNDHPQRGEQALYPFSWHDPNRRGYALIGYKRNLSGDGHTLLLGGTTSAGTDAAIEFLMSPAFMAPLMKKAERPDGTVADFEVLLQCVLQANGSTDIQLLGQRIKSS